MVEPGGPDSRPKGSDTDVRSPPQFSLRALFVVVTLVAVVCAYFAWPPKERAVGSLARQRECAGQKNSAIFLGIAEVKQRGSQERHEWKAALIVAAAERLRGFSYGTELFGHQAGYQGLIDEAGRIHVRIERYEGNGIPVSLPRSIAWVDPQGTVTHVDTEIDGEAMEYVISQIEADSGLKDRLDDSNGLDDFHTLVKEILAKRTPPTTKQP